ncbi:MAG: hypothetical protein ACYC2T_05460 [Bacillota bacterium]
MKNDHPVTSGESIGIIGGGVAGIALARQLLLQASLSGTDIRVKLFNSHNCNYCGGLITYRAAQVLRQLYGWEIDQDLVIDRLEGCLYVNREGTIPVKFQETLFSTFRVDKFGFPGFDTFLRRRLLDGLSISPESLEVHEPSVVTGVACPQRTLGHKGKIYYHKGDTNERVEEIDLLAVATGLRSIDGAVTGTLRIQAGYVPPPMLEASVAELDLGDVQHRLNHQLLVAHGILTGCAVAVIPKGPRWLTVVSLGRSMTTEDLEELFGYPAIIKLTGVSRPHEKLRCGHICPARVHTGPARRFYGDGWIALGDLTGYGRVLKDGYYASLMGAYFAGVTFFKYGTNRETLRRYYQWPLARLGDNNRIGMWLYRLDRRFASNQRLSGILNAAARWELARQGQVNEIHSALGSLHAANLPYLKIAGMLVRGVGKYLIIRTFTPHHRPAMLFSALKKPGGKQINRGDDR